MRTNDITVQDIEKSYGALTFGNLLRAYREGEELSQVEMAKKIKLSKQSLNDIENGRKIPSISRAVLLAKKVGILPELAVELVLQDQLNRENLKMVVRVSSYKTRRKEESKKSITINGIKLLGHDSSAIFKNQKEIKRALLEAFMDCDKEAFVDILSVWVRTHNILEVCRRTGLSRTVVYEAISGGGKPSLDTLFKIMGLFKKSALVKSFKS